jgi:hypothetical protein
LAPSDQQLPDEFVARLRARRVRREAERAGRPSYREWYTSEVLPHLPRTWLAHHNLPLVKPPVTTVMIVGDERAGEPDVAGGGHPAGPPPRPGPKTKPLPTLLRAAAEEYVDGGVRSQRDIADDLEISPGKVKYAIERVRVERGLIPRK